MIDGRFSLFDWSAGFSTEVRPKGRPLSEKGDGGVKIAHQSSFVGLVVDDVLVDSPFSTEVLPEGWPLSEKGDGGVKIAHQSSLVGLVVDFSGRRVQKIAH